MNHIYCVYQHLLRIFKTNNLDAILLEETTEDRKCAWRTVRVCKNGNYVDVHIDEHTLALGSRDFKIKIVDPISQQLNSRNFKLTREEAIEKLSDAYIKAGSVRSKSTIEGYLIAFETLGLIKFDEPEKELSVHEAIHTARLISLNETDQSEFIEMLIKLGYKVVKI